jgi:hypothetical protein
MTFKTSRNAFESALQIAEAREDSAMEFLASGLALLAKALQAEAASTARRLSDIEAKINRLR